MADTAGPVNRGIPGNPKGSGNQPISGGAGASGGTGFPGAAVAAVAATRPGRPLSDSELSRVRAELLAVRRAVDDAREHMRVLRATPVNARLAGRLETDIRRVAEDLDDLAAETLPAAGGGQAVPGAATSAATGAATGTAAGPTPVPVPDRLDGGEFQPECDDEGVGGLWPEGVDERADGRRRRRRRHTTNADQGGAG